MSDSVGSADPGPPPDSSPPGGGPPSGAPPGPPGGANAARAPILAALARAHGAPPSVPGAGAQADAMMKIKAGLDMIQAALPALPVGSQVHRAALAAISGLSRHLPQGSPTAGVQRTMLMDLLQGTMRNAIAQKVAAQQGKGAPPPSTPLPGA